MTAALILDQSIQHMRRGGTLILMGLSVGILACLTYAGIMSHNFTATDTLTLIDTSRVRTIQDALDVFVKPLMAGSIFRESGLFYHPVSSYSYGHDFILWKLNPFGYHLIDRVLPAVACMLVFSTTLVMTRGRRVALWIGALLFTLHPILVETVPAIARRQDVLAAIFMMHSLLLLVPTGIDSPARSGALRTGFLGACGPRVAVTVICLGLRLHALGGFGGHLRSGASLGNLVLFWVSTTKQYVMDLVIPVVPPGLLPDEVARAGSLALPMASIFLMLLVARFAPLFMPHKVVGGILASPSARVMAYRGLSRLYLLPSTSQP